MFAINDNSIFLTARCICIRNMLLTHTLLTCCRNETYKRFGIRLAFVATRSGLLRFSDHSDLFPSNHEVYGDEEEFIEEP